MKILELGKFYPPYRGGMETLLECWSRGFVRRGGEVNCVVANTASQTVHEVLDGVKVHRLASHGSLLSTSLCPAYLSATKTYPSDVWQAHFPNPLADVACLRGDPKTPMVLTYHSDIIRQSSVLKFYRPILKRLLDRADVIVVATPNHLKYSHTLPPYAAKVEVIPFGIDQSRFLHTDAAEQEEVVTLRQKAQMRPILLNIGRLVGYKGQSYLVDAIQGLDVEVWFAGTGPLQAELEQQVSRLGLQNRVKFWGGVDDRKLATLLKACDVFVFPSITPNEAFGIVQIEAMACAKPIICTDLPSGVPWVNQHNVTGLVVKPSDVQDLRNGIKQLIENPALARKMGEQGRQRAAVEFTEDRMIDRYWELFQRLRQRA
ncbi:MAG TPA: glycosyltransferase [Verrucomicrobiae bacterium]